MSQFVTFTLGGSLYGVAVTRVQEALRAHTRTRVPLAPVGVAGLVNLRGQVVLTVDLRARLGLEPLAEGAEPMMVVVQVAGEPVSLLVDEIGDVVDVGPEAFEPPPDTLDVHLRSVILGAYKLDHDLLLVLDVDAAAAA
ncbi:chemotaxis protein CheW [Cellulomonas chengniuliangii]|uniref:Chemotaxis protein CheW n=1 Tax=Cellulomonas chengniuliangii TaxID=2968084 RepID=A0ABY5L0P0_9CELL|nr:chemotaxis protein CheW [Cellulomonas chengniuliangii]MCC2307245.1 chemotaxis protein CheW [Cellulomonas chengniuliangii]MCC2317859.1 chemotaxis protein CheW [Cellulomonas chengniuliangii]UUI75959.1 chemotaxis protein CheW [Cellulomonas chengniuliangii]